MIRRASNPTFRTTGQRRICQTRQAGSRRGLTLAAGMLALSTFSSCVAPRNTSLDGGYREVGIPERVVAPVIAVLKLPFFLGRVIGLVGDNLTYGDEVNPMGAVYGPPAALASEGIYTIFYDSMVNQWLYGVSARPPLLDGMYSNWGNVHPIIPEDKTEGK